ncbi:glutathione S-transferase N-terminal domain-containing protein [Methylobacterium sp. WSM2598]|uniref:glutathione S-transferase N-terminal domain-containing protein n=1 Tax=Methylobacterium sp. WSM2598 TaxID=398261 RepID=UPI0012F6D3DD|nr:glutathione S-transferase N-terminal domain-containing protein [Methylobacterium sp. WSM2598]
MRLYVMKISHYCERARWGLDHKGFQYEEQAWAPALHVPLARRIAKETCLPILVSGESVVQGSGPILTWAGLGGGDAALEHRFEAVIGPLIREYFYAGTLHDSHSGVREVLLHGVPSVQTFLGHVGWPMIRRAMASHMAIRPERLPELEHRIDAELEWVDTLVAEGGPLGGGFGRTAITAASILAPLARPDALPLYRQVRLAPEMERAFARWSARPALDWVLDTYARHRHRTQG